ncbi:MAG: transporter [bacterium]|nr:transporter [bacterium]
MKYSKKVLNTRIILCLCTITLLLVLLLFPKASLKGAELGVLLWFNVIFPTLLPFIIVSNLIINLRLTNAVSRVFHPFLHRILHVSKQGSYVTILGLLTGLPVGAKACGDLVKDQLISREEGQYLLTFCNNASPMFILSYVSITTLDLPGKRYIFLLLIYLSAILTGFVYRLIHKKQMITFAASTKREIVTQMSTEIGVPTKHSQPRARFVMVDSAIMSGFDVLTKVGGYIILFSIISNVFLAIAPENNLLSYIVVGSIELTNGVNTIGSSIFPLSVKIALILSLTAFGGLSSVAQTKSVIDESGLSIKKYLVYKIINAGITFVIITIYLQLCKF